MSNLLNKIDAQLEELFRGWNFLTTGIVIVLVLYAAYPLFYPNDPDTHPFLLARQAVGAPVRQAGESAAYRTQEIPNGYPLRTGLGIKDSKASRWSPTKDGDLRDIWRRTLSGVPTDAGDSGRELGKIMTIRGNDEIKEHSLDDLSNEIVQIGSYIRQSQGARVALYLPNSTEFLCSIFAAAFYGFSPILIPYHTPADVVINYIQKTEADTVITQAGALALDTIQENCKTLKNLIYVVPETSRNVEWREDNANIRLQTWHDIVDGKQATSTELPTDEENDSLKAVVFIWQGRLGPSDVAFSQANLVSGIGALTSALPSQHKLTPNDLLLPADSLCNCYALCHTFAALFANASIALNSQAGPDIDILLATQRVTPTIVVASPESGLKLHKASEDAAAGIFQKFFVYRNSSTLKAGRLPSSPAVTIRNLNKLRLLYLSERAGGDSPPVTPTELHDLRAYTGARVIYALTAAKVAGAVTQTGFYDYRKVQTRLVQRSHFGAPLSSVEIKVVDKGETITTDDGSKIEGEVFAKGPAVAGGEKDAVDLGFLGRFGEDGTLEYL